MNSENLIAQRSSRVWLTPESCNLEDFKKLIDRKTDAFDYPFAISAAL